MTIRRALFSYAGRMGRSEWWLGLVLAWAIVGTITLASRIIGYQPFALADPLSTVLRFLGYMAGAAFFVALHVKRWHDRGKSGWMVLVGLIPIVGGLWILVELGFLPGSPEPNDYGGPPVDQSPISEGDVVLWAGAGAVLGAMVLHVIQHGF